MRRCQHRNARIKEDARGTNDWHLEDGVLVSDGWDHSLTGGLWIICEECGLDRFYAPGGRWPVWVRDIAHLIYDHSVNR